ncbi:MAG: hypothetical protein ACFFD6_02985 [Candidatus Thorarchaeota archaeon]
MLELGDQETEDIKERILSGGRSPTLIATCTQGHQILVTLYFRDDEFGVRDVMVPIKADKKESKEVSEIDWIGDAFGGGG